MKYRNYFLCIICILLISAATAWAENNDKVTEAEQTTVANPADYIIGPGDQLDIAVWKDEALTKLATVLPDGKIYFPLIGEVIAEGKTVAQLKKEMEKLISKYVPEVVLNVDVRQVNSMLVYVIGQVNTPGRLTLNTNITVLQALAMSGGPNTFARRGKIRIFRTEGGETKVFQFEYDDVSEGKKMERNITLHRGDTIVVP